MIALIEQKTKTPKQLGLRPTVHRSIVPTEKKLATAERTVGLLPFPQIDGTQQHLIQCRKPAFQQDRHIDTLSIIIQLSSIDCRPGSAGERFGQTSLIKQVSNVIIDPAFNGLGAFRIPSKSLYLR